MLAHERLRVIERALQCRQHRLVPDIPQRHTNVAEKPATFDAEDRRPSEECPELRLVPRQKLRKPRQRARAKLRQSGETVPRADFEADVTPKHTVTNQWTQLNRDAPFQLDG